MNDFHQRHIEIAAISVDSTVDSRKLSEAKGYTFPVLSDPNAEVIRRYGLLHPKGGEDGQDIARPAELAYAFGANPCVGRVVRGIADAPDGRPQR